MMDKTLESLFNKFKNSEAMTSIVFGGIVVVIAAFMLINYFKPDNSARLSDKGEATESAQISQNGTLPAEHVVNKGERLWDIAEKYYQSGYNWVDIAKANNITKPAALAAGAKITIPAVQAKKVTAKAVKAEAPVVKAEVQQITGEEYTVAQGDNLWNIAVRAYGDGYAWTKIYKANASIGKNPGIIEVGVKLSIPR